MEGLVEALGLPPTDAIAFLRDKLVVPYDRFAALEDAARARAFSIAGAASEAMLADFRDELARLAEEGGTLADFEAAFEELAGKHGWDYRGEAKWRSRIIFQTNLNEAYAAGRWFQQTSPEVTEAFPFWEYAHSGALDPREQHLAWDGIVLRWDDPFWARAYPPNGFGCGCFVLPLSLEDLERLGKMGPDPTPDLAEVLTFVNGAPRTVVRGIDPGFESRPGGDWLPDWREAA